MSNCGENKNPLLHNGTSQPQRLLPGLDKNVFAKVDAKDFADWIVFADEFAVFINYHNFSNSVEGNWQPFFSSDISARYGILAIQSIESYREEVKERLLFIRDSDNKLLLPDIQLKLNELFSALLTLSKAMDIYLLQLPEESTLRNTILNSIKNKMAPALQRLIGYQKGAEALTYLTHAPLSAWKIFNLPLTDEKQIIDTDGLSNYWFDESAFASWTLYTNSIAEDRSIFNNPLTAFADEFLSIEHAANHNLFTGIFDTYLTAYTKIVQDAKTALLKTLEHYDLHTPHYALFISFLKLFKFSQANINTITQRHLDFYYKEVLRLQPKPAQANKVHVLGELAKQVDSYLLAQGTALKAGKDSLSKDVNYTLDNDTVFNKAAVSQLKTFFKGGAADSVFNTGTTTIKQNNTGRIFASPIVNSEDGNGAALTSANKEWAPYVHKVFKEGELDSISMPKAKIGFAIASHYLYLTEGERKVFVRFVLNNLSALDGKNIECWLTTEKGWWQVPSLVISSSGKTLSDNATSCAEIAFTIPGSVAAIVNYKAAVHGGTYNVALPVLKIYLANNDDSIYEYDLLKDITLTKTEIRVEVGMDGGYNQNGLKNVLLSNDFGVLDPSKPFQVFGPQPVKNDRLVIGSKEIFSKKNTTIQFNLEWKGLPVTPLEVSYGNQEDTGIIIIFIPGEGIMPGVSLRILEDGIWKNAGGSYDLFDWYVSPSSSNGFIIILGEATLTATNQIELPASATGNSIVDYADDYPLYDINSNKGFLALQLNLGFGNKEYQAAQTNYLILTAQGNPPASAPVQPYTPVLQSFYVSYSAWTTVDVSDASTFNDREIQFFHIYPFGEAEQHKQLTSGSSIYLVPQFKHSDQGVTVTHIGEFYIGIEHLNPDSAVNILFEVLEGTSNPTVVKPANHIHWSYLGNNQWIEFADQAYSDNTLALVQSGIISFAIPVDAGIQHTVLPAGFIWLRASIAEAAEAVCELLSVDAQASVASFADNGNAADFLDKALLAGTITKLKLPDAAVKKINQPYSSFGGHAAETSDHFYIRVSERLRHKARGITVWDYEHLVLEAFPQIYKVKCLNHTRIETGIYNEVQPGYVSIITIPSLQNRNDANPLKPYTQQSILTNIEIYLRSRISCFVNLHACQPQFEEIRLEFSLKLYDQYKDFSFYSNKLKEEITQYLSPWAFDSNSVIDFGGKAYKSVLINFIEERYYVDFITDVFMYVRVDDTTAESGDKDEIDASTARSILVSAPASKHVIHEITIVDTVSQEECPGSGNVIVIGNQNK